MKKNILILLLSVLTIYSCTEQKFDFVPDNADITFAKASQTFVIEGQDLEIQLQRGVLNNQTVLNIEIDDKLGIFTLASPTVTFNQGENYAKIIVKYNKKDIEPVTNYSFKLSFNEADKAPAGINSIVVSGMMPLTWKEYGEMTFTGSTFSGLLSLDFSKVYKLLQSNEAVNYYKVIDLYGSTSEMPFYIENGLGNIFDFPFSYYNNLGEKPLYRFASAISHPSYGLMTIYLDTNPKVSIWKNIDGNKLTVGSTWSIDSYYTVSAGYFGWKTDTFTVTKVN